MDLDSQLDPLSLVRLYDCLGGGRAINPSSYEPHA